MNIGEEQEELEVQPQKKETVNPEPAPLGPQEAPSVPEPATAPGRN